jgi:hypothetical protein
MSNEVGKKIQAQTPFISGITATGKHILQTVKSLWPSYLENRFTPKRVQSMYNPAMPFGGGKSGIVVQVKSK